MAWLLVRRIMASENQVWLNTRSSGVLAHISSLPGEFGIGNMGANALRFVDFLSESGFAFWQVCPVGPTGYGDSPYQSFSSFAGNPYFIDIGRLVEQDLLSESEVGPLTSLPTDRVDYGTLYQIFWNILTTAHERIDPKSYSLESHPPIHQFIEENAYWLDSYTTFMALKRKFDNKPWTEWPIEFINPNIEYGDFLNSWDQLEKSRHAFYQYLFYCRWNDLKNYANGKGIEIIGDMPIYVALDSADVWSNRDIFRVDEAGDQDYVAGVPPDYFSITGQLWGNPLYQWERISKNGYKWWIKRIQASLKLFDVLRLDHFRGFENYWAVPDNSPDASLGSWETGPGFEFFQTVMRVLPEARFIAEDLGYIDRDVFELRERTGFPGMKIMQFGFGHDENNVNLPHFFRPNQVAYTGTHDNDTTRGWLDSLEGETKDSVCEYFGIDDSSDPTPVIRAAFASVANLVIIPVQDLLGLSSIGRMNTPGTTTGNWNWRLSSDQFENLFKEIAPKYAALNQRYHRIENHRQHDFSEPPQK